VFLLEIQVILLVLYSLKW